MTTTIQDTARQAGKLATGADIKTAKAGARLRFGGGLYLLVGTGGAKSWQVHYHVAGKHQATIIGRWPDLGIVEAKDRRETIRQHVRAGIKPARDEAKSLADAALIAAFTKWKPSRERRYDDSVLLKAFDAWRATR